MKKYSTTMLNGFILGISTMLFIGAKRQFKDLGDITVNSISVVDKNDKLRAFINRSAISMLGESHKTMIFSTGISIDNSKHEQILSLASSDDDTGIIEIYNSKRNQVVYIGVDAANDDGLIKLYDRYGDAGWGATGKR